MDQNQHAVIHLSFCRICNGLISRDGKIVCGPSIYSVQQTSLSSLLAAVVRDNIQRYQDVFVKSVAQVMLCIVVSNQGASKNSRVYILRSCLYEMFLLKNLSLGLNTLYPFKLS